jgi:NADPH-dependent glutamate synthase beta subunit-like oxidoreductase/NAD(P)H-flavin reductase
MNHNLYDHQCLKALHASFLSALPSHLRASYILWSQKTFPISRFDAAGRLQSEWIQYNQFLQDISPFFEEVVGDLFGINDALLRMKKEAAFHQDAFFVKRQFIQRHGVRAYAYAKEEEAMPNLDDVLGPRWRDEDFVDMVRARGLMSALDDPLSKRLAHYAAWAVLHPQGKKRHRASSLFQQPEKKDWHHLLRPLDEDTPLEPLGFSLRDHGLCSEKAAHEAHYCIRCHPQAKDSCAHGMRPPKANGNDLFQQNPLGVSLTGCPLEQNISLMNTLKVKGYNLAALAVIMIDNPMVAATGHRICNDCRTGCIFQQQDSVDVPGIESQILKSILHLDFGFEIYSLLTRWNPFHIASPVPHPFRQQKVLVAGMGPAGFTLSHYLTHFGYQVVGIDGVKIDPLPRRWTRPHDGTGFLLVQRIEDIHEDLHHRIPRGFGGVSTYGITNRWDKNYLTIIRLILQRRENFTLMGGVRLGSNLSLHQAFFDMDFHHVGLCIGAGPPRIPPTPGMDATGVRLSSDFLMTLQLGQAWKDDRVSNLMIEFPVVIIGGGLSAMDSAVEALAYYPHMVRRIAKSVEKNHHLMDDPRVAALVHHHQRFIQTPKNQWHEIFNDLGGVTVVYRNSITKAPSYKENVGEVQDALDHGVRLLDHTQVTSIIKDPQDNHVVGVEVGQHVHDGAPVLTKILPARCVIVATGTNAHEFIDMDHHDPKWKHRISLVGDVDPDFRGSVVKAMASAKKAKDIIHAQLLKESPLEKESNAQDHHQEWVKGLKHNLEAHVVGVKDLSPGIFEIIIHAPQCAQNVRPGQFFRLERLYHDVDFNKCFDDEGSIEPIALTSCWVDLDLGHVGLVVLDVGTSSRRCRLLQPGEQVALMGPTGMPTEIPTNEKILLIGGGLGNAVLFSIAKEMKRHGNRVMYMAGYRSPTTRFYQKHIEQSADQVIWCVDPLPMKESDEPRQTLSLGRPQDITVVASMIDAVKDYQQKRWDTIFSMEQIDRVIVIGSSPMMHRISHFFLHEVGEVKPSLKVIASINAPMQCMMKGICGQCIGRHIDPITGKQSFVFSCIEQDQDARLVDFAMLHQRLKQNDLLEML